MCPDNRRHRGAHPEDTRLFDAKHLPALRTATEELSWLLSRGYAIQSSLKLVGDRHGLTERQRLAVSRAACSDASREGRRATCLPLESIRGEGVLIDGFNLLITLEAALGGGLLMLCRDDCLRDLSSVHGSYRSVEETDTALHLVGETLAELAPASVCWLLDRPISNSGRLAQRIREMAEEKEWLWTVETLFDPDGALRASSDIVITSDSVILDSVSRWVNFAATLIPQSLPQAWLTDFRQNGPVDSH